MWTNGHFRRTFGFGRKQRQSYHIRCIFGFGVLQLVNSVVAESGIQSLSCGGRECARRRESLASLCTDWLCKDNRGSRCLCLHLHGTVGCGLWPVGPDRLALMTHYTAHKVGVRVKGPDTIDFRFRFSAESKTSAFSGSLKWNVTRYQLNTNTNQQSVVAMRADRKERHWSLVGQSSGHLCPLDCRALVGGQSQCMCGLDLGQYACACPPGLHIDGHTCAGYCFCNS